VGNFIIFWLQRVKIIDNCFEIWQELLSKVVTCSGSEWSWIKFSMCVLCRCFSWHSMRRFSQHSALPSVHKPQDTYSSPCLRYFIIWIFCRNFDYYLVLMTASRVTFLVLYKSDWLLIDWLIGWFVDWLMLGSTSAQSFNSETVTL